MIHFFISVVFNNTKLNVLYNRFDKSNNTKNGFDHSLIFSPNNNAVPICIILNMTEEECFLKYSPVVENKSIQSSTEKNNYVSILYTMLSNFDIEEIAYFYEIDIVVVMKDELIKIKTYF